MGSGCCKEKSTICWSCDNACGKCCWSQSFKPVPGWTATPTKVYQSKGVYQDSFLVQKCPQFKKGDTRCEIKISDIAESILHCSIYVLYKLKDDEIIKLCRNKGVYLNLEYKKNKKRVFYMVERKPINIPSKELMQLFFGKQKGYTGF